MADLKVVGEVLSQSASSLATLQTEFDGIERRRDDSREIWGHEAVRDAVGEFASNMDYNRGKLSEQMGSVREKIVATSEAFEEMESELASSFESTPASTGGSR